MAPIFIVGNLQARNLFRFAYRQRSCVPQTKENYGMIDTKYLKFRVDQGVWY
jgi:hypothetical protein